MSTTLDIDEFNDDDIGHSSLSKNGIFSLHLTASFIELCDRGASISEIHLTLDELIDLGNKAKKIKLVQLLKGE